MHDRLARGRGLEDAPGIDDGFSGDPDNGLALLHGTSRGEVAGATAEDTGSSEADLVILEEGLQGAIGTAVAVGPNSQEDTDDADTGDDRSNHKWAACGILFSLGALVLLDQSSRWWRHFH